jgi:hypothetical protein
MRKHRIHTLDELIKRFIDDMEWFWDACAKDLKIERFKPYKKVLDTSKGIEWARWFIGGKLNIAHNCTDRHAGTRGDKTAIIWQGEDGEVRRLSYEGLHTHTKKHAQPRVQIRTPMPLDRRRIRFQITIPVLHNTGDFSITAEVCFGSFWFCGSAGAPGSLR